MGYLFLMIAVLAGSVKGYCGKKTSNYVDDYKSMIFANIIRMVLCGAIGIFLIIVGKNMRYITSDITILAISALSGISTSVFVICWLVSVKKSAYMMLDVFLMLGVVVTLILSRIFFNEKVELNQWIGMGVLFAAVLIMCSYNNSIKTKMNLSSVLLLILCGVSNGLTDFSQKLFVKQAEGVPIMIFNCYTYIFSAVVLIIAYFFGRNRKDAVENGQNTIKCFYKIFGYIFVMSVCLFINSYFKTMAAGFLDAAKLYPLNQGCGLVLSSIMAAVFFHEKITLKGIVGIVLAFVGLIIINVL